MRAHAAPIRATPTDEDRADAAVAIVRDWLVRARSVPTSAAGRRLAAMVADPEGLAFAVAFVDGVVRPEDARVSARALAHAARRPPAFLPAAMRGALAVGGRLAPLAPPLAAKAAQRVLRTLVGHLILDARPAQLGRSLTRLRESGVDVNLNLLGEAVLGKAQAKARLEGTRRLLERPDVDYVSLKVSSIVAPYSAWAFDAAAEHIVRTLEPLYEDAARTGTFINLDMEEYRDLDLTLEVFTRILDQERFLGLTAGIVLQAYLPDSMPAMKRLQEWSAARVARGGSPIKVRVVKGANLSMERVDAEWHGWALATWHEKAESDAHFKRILDYALTPERLANVRIGVAGHNLFDIAHAWLLANDRAATDGVDFEMLLGMADGVGTVVSEDVGRLRLYTPVVAPAEFDVAVAYLVRRLEEVASPQNFLSAAFALDTDPAVFAREEKRFRASVALVSTEVPGRHRGVPMKRAAGFTNQPDTDPSLPESRAWAARIAARAAASELGARTVADSWMATSAEVDAVLARAESAAQGWRAIGATRRAEVLDAAADALESSRGDLVEVMMSEAGKTVDQGDPEVSEAVDFARYYAASARALDRVAGAAPHARPVTVVTPPWNFPVAIPAGSVLAALASGSAVIIKPAPATTRCAAVVVEALWDAGVPRDVLQFVDCDAAAIGRDLVGDPRVDQVILTGAYETAERFRGFRDDLRVLAETSGKNSIIVTPHADLDLAVRDVVASAFGHAGQKCSATSLVILVGSVSQSRRFRDQLVDAVESLNVGPAWNLETQMGPVIAPPTGKLARGLNELGPGERWLVEPRSMDASGSLWTPGVREGVRPGSDFHRTEFFGPILGIMTAHDLDEAIELQNAVDYGLTAGLHSLDRAEAERWIARVQAGNLYVNRGTTGAIVQRQPFGGWKKSAVGAGAKAGGPHYVAALTDWVDAPTASAGRPHERAKDLVNAARSLLERTDGDWLTAAATDDRHTWEKTYGREHDRAGLTSERNVSRYVAARVEIRAGRGASQRDILRVACAAAVAAPGTCVSVDPTVTTSVRKAIAAAGLVVLDEDASAWAERVSSGDYPRVRSIGAVEAPAQRADIAIFGGCVTSSGLLELFPFVREQAISITAHRFGTRSASAYSVDCSASISAS